MAVIKIFKDPPLRNKYIDAQNQLKVISLANDYARRFNKLL